MQQGHNNKLNNTPKLEFKDNDKSNPDKLIITLSNDNKKRHLNCI